MTTNDKLLWILTVLELDILKGAVKKCVAMGNIYCLFLQMALSSKRGTVLLLNNYIMLLLGVLEYKNSNSSHSH